MMNWKVIDTGIQSAQKNMELDGQLLESMNGAESPILHFYEWEAPSATYGYFIDPFKHLDMEQARSQIQLAKRPTGGGIVFHVTDFAFSLLMPASHPAFSQNTLENYAFVNGIVTRAIAPLVNDSIPSLLDREELSHSSPHFCMANPTMYDVMINGRKVGGAAQRRTKHGYLHQGSIFLTMPPEGFLDSILLDKEVVERMKDNSFPLLGYSADSKQIREAKEFIRAALRLTHSKGLAI
jgi:lipoate-protein ligase A